MSAQSPRAYMTHALVLVVALACSAQVTRAQAAPSASTICPDFGLNISYATAVVVDSHGNTVVTGGKRLNDYATGEPLGSAFVTVKYDDTGHQLWSRSYQGSFACFHHANAISTDQSGNVYVTGTVWLSGNDPAHPGIDISQLAYATIKYDAAGNRKWLTQYHAVNKKDQSQKDQPLGIALDTEGNVYVTGLSDGQSKEIATVKYDGRNGDQLWVARYSAPDGVIHSRAPALDRTDHMYVAATVCTKRTAMKNCSDFEYRVLKYDSTGKLLWTAAYENGSGFASAVSGLVTDRAGSIYVTGTSCSTPFIVREWPGGGVQSGCDEADYATLKLNPDGAPAWVTRYHGSASGNYEPEAITVDDGGQVYVTGSGANQDRGFHSVKYDRDGKQMWASVFESLIAIPHAIAVNPKGQTYVAGLSVYGQYGYFSVVAYDADGSKLWDHEVQGLDRSRDWDAVAAVIDSKGRLHVTGGTLDVPPGMPSGSGPVGSSYLTRVFGADSEGDVLWSRQF